MISIIAPAKGFIEIPQIEGIKPTELIFKNEIKILIDILKQLNSDEISTLMKTSKEISDLNYERYQTFFDNNLKEHMALLYINGEAYKGIDASTLNADDLNFAQNNLRILSGLYGVIKPLDMIKEYRLEMGTKLANNLGKDLYAYWKEKLTNILLDELHNTSGDKVLLNISSDEYSKSINLKSINKIYPVINISFKENKNGSFKVVGMYAKKARGQFVRYILQNKIEHLEETKGFNIDGYSFNEELSNENNFIFTR